MQGYIKLHRQLLNWEWYSDINVKVLFLHCLLLANHEGKKWQGQEIKAGQFVTSLEHLAIGSGLTIQQVRTALNKLKLTNEITSKTTSHYSMITINNWDKWQTNNIQDNKQITNNQQTINKQITTNKNDKNDKNDKNMFVIAKFDPFINPLKQKFDEVYQKVYGKNPHLSRDECYRLVELSTQYDNFDELLPDAIEKLHDITFSFADGDKKPKANWLLKDDNFSKVIKGEFEVTERTNLIERLGI